MLKPGGLKGLLIQMNCLIVLCYTNEISLQGSVLLQYRCSILFSPTALLIQQEKEKTVICYFYHSQGSFTEEQNSVQNVWNYLRMWTEGEASGVFYSCTGTLCVIKKKRGQHEGQNIFSLTLNKGIVKSTFPFHIILFLYEHLVVRTDVHNDPEQIQRAS